MHYFIYGPPASGKSTISRVLADHLNLPVYDLDQVIEARAGKVIPEIFAEEQETGFRKREWEALTDIISLPDGVVALGGGALLSEKSRAATEDNGIVIVLSTDYQVLKERIQEEKLENGGAKRPLLADDPEEALLRLLRTREDHYASFHNHLNVSGKTVEQAVRELQILLGAFHVTGMGDGYDIRVQMGGLNRLGVELKKRNLLGPVAVSSDNNVIQIYGGKLEKTIVDAGFHCKLLSLPAGENTKTIENAGTLWEFFLKNSLERKSTVIALGGGVIGDLTGFAASTYLRGIPWVNIPTSLLAMVDASIGGKTGANLPQGKNLVGSFHAPNFVLIDPAVLSTLPLAELRSGMAEVVKHAVISDPVLFEMVSASWGNILENWQSIVSRAVAVKVDVIQSDPYESGLRQVLNLGHTLGHAVEKVSSFRIRHGEAVAIGMVIEAEIAERIGIAQKGTARTIAQCLKNIGLPTKIPEFLSKDEIIAAMQYDKKKVRGQIRFSLPEEVGKVKFGVVIDNVSKYF